MTVWLCLCEREGWKGRGEVGGREREIRGELVIVGRSRRRKTRGGKVIKLGGGAERH